MNQDMNNINQNNNVVNESQELNNFVVNNTQINPSTIPLENKNNSKFKKLLLIIGIITIIVAIIFLVFLFGTKLIGTKKSSSNNSSNIKSKEWVEATSIKEYQIKRIEAVNLSEIQVEKPVIKYDFDKGSITFDFRKADFFPTNIYDSGFDGTVSMRQLLQLDDNIGEATSEYDSLLPEGYKTLSCGENKVYSDTYYVCIFGFDEERINLSVDLAKASLDEAKEEIKKVLRIITLDDKDAISPDEFNDNLELKVKYNTSSLKLDNKDEFGSLNYSYNNGKIRVENLGERFGFTMNYHNSYNNYNESIIFYTSFGIPEIFNREAYLAKEINDNIRIYKSKDDRLYCSSMYNSFHYYYVIGLVEDNTEYILVANATTDFSTSELATQKDIENKTCDSDFGKPYYNEVEKQLIEILLKSF